MSAAETDFKPGVRSGRTNTNVVARLTTETKQAFKTTEFWAMVLLIIGTLIASRVVGDNNGNANGTDAFPAARAWLYIAIIGAAYMVSAVSPRPAAVIRTGPTRTISLAAATSATTTEQRLGSAR